MSEQIKVPSEKNVITMTHSGFSETTSVHRLADWATEFMETEEDNPSNQIKVICIQVTQGGMGRTEALKGAGIVPEGGSDPCQFFSLKKSGEGAK